VLVTRTAALESLAKLTRVVLDKTGTLTHGRPTVESCIVTGDVPEQSCRHIAFALEQGSEHPIARAFRFGECGPHVATNVQFSPGYGIEGTVNGQRYRIGRREFLKTSSAAPNARDDNHIYLGNAAGELASFKLEDRLRNEAPSVIGELRARQLAADILSGDAWVAVAKTAQLCGIENYVARQSPKNKLDYVRDLTARGETVAMVGDGLNDAPVLKVAAVSIAMGRASALAQVCADIVLIGDTLGALPAAIDIARRTQRVVKQNLMWAATYNVIALPLAALGFVPPWLAAVGMSASSIVVVLNALRLSPKKVIRDS
jgi:Cu2+-exporting ATPase